MDVRIEADETKKGHAFGFRLAAFIECPRIVAESGSGTTRPVWCVSAMSDALTIPVRANLMMGRKFGALKDSYKGGWSAVFELLKSMPYAFELQKHPEGSLLTAYLPTYLVPDPGFVDPMGIRCAVLTTDAWVARMMELQKPTRDAALKYARRALGKDFDAETAEAILPMVPLILQYLDRRSRVPLIPDLRFQLQLALRLDEQKLLTAVGTLGNRSYGLSALGLADPWFAACTHEQFETIAANESARYLKLTS